VSRRVKVRSQRVTGEWYDAEVVYRRDRKGNLVVQVGSTRYRRRSWRYWRAWGLAVATVARRGMTPRRRWLALEFATVVLVPTLFSHLSGISTPLWALVTVPVAMGVGQRWGQP
jgi:hypothetical protein